MYALLLRCSKIHIIYIDTGIYIYYTDILLSYIVLLIWYRIVLYHYLVMFLIAMLKSFGMTEFKPDFKADIYNFIISQRSFDSWTHNCNPLYFTAFKYSNLIIGPVTIMPITIANDCSELDIQDNDSSNTDTRATQGHNMNTNIMFTHDRSVLNDTDPDTNYIDSNC